MDWNNLANSADTLEDWLALFELSIKELDIMSRQSTMLAEQNTMFNKLFTGGVDGDIMYLNKRIEDYELLKEVSREKILEYGQ